MELLTAFVSACQNVKFSSVCIVLLGVILFQSVRQRIAQSGMSEEEKKVQLQTNWNMLFLIANIAFLLINLKGSR